MEKLPTVDCRSTALSSIEYDEKVFAEYPDARTDSSRGDFYRLFMVPGMGNCAGGAGPNMFGKAPIRWARRATTRIEMCSPF
jgi:hypothetical protein